MKQSSSQSIMSIIHKTKDSKGNGGGLNCGSLNKATEHQNEIIH